MTDERSERLRKRRKRARRSDRSGNDADGDDDGRSPGGGPRPESAGPAAVSGTTDSSESSQPSERSERSEPTDPSERDGTPGPAEGSGSADAGSAGDGNGASAGGDDGEGAGSVKEEQVGTYMYLPKSQTKDLKRVYNVLKAEYEFEFDAEFEKNRHFYPLVVQYGLDGLEEMDAAEVRDRLEGMHR